MFLLTSSGAHHLCICQVLDMNSLRCATAPQMQRTENSSNVYKNCAFCCRRRCDLNYGGRTSQQCSASIQQQLPALPTCANQVDFNCCCHVNNSVPIHRSFHPEDVTSSRRDGTRAAALSGSTMTSGFIQPVDSRNGPASLDDDVTSARVELMPASAGRNSEIRGESTT